MRRHFRTLFILALAAGLLGLFLRQVDLGSVAREIRGASAGWLALSLCSMYLNLAIRSMRWQYLLAPIGRTSFFNAFRATAVGFAARGVLPSAAGELVRPYFLSRHEPISATGAFATVIIERLVDLLTILGMLAVFVLVSGRNLTSTHAAAYAAVTWAGLVAGGLAISALVLLLVVAGRPDRFLQIIRRIERLAPARVAGLLEGVAQKFVGGLAAVRNPMRLLVILGWSIPLWLCIGFGVWAVAMAFGLDVPFTGSFLLIAFLTIGITIPTPGAVGGFHESFRIGATQFFGAPEGAAVGAAIVLHALSIGSSLVLGIIFAAQAGMNVSGFRAMVADAESGEAA